MKFSKGQDIKTEGEVFTCLLCDEEFACFAQLKTGLEREKSIDMTNLFIVSNIKGFKDGFKYEDI